MKLRYAAAAVLVAIAGMGACSPPDEVQVAKFNDAQIREYKKCVEAGMKADLSDAGNVICVPPGEKKP